MGPLPESGLIVLFYAGWLGAIVLIILWANAVARTAGRERTAGRDMPRVGPRTVERPPAPELPDNDAAAFESLVAELRRQFGEGKTTGVALVPPRLYLGGNRDDRSLTRGRIDNAAALSHLENLAGRPWVGGVWVRVVDLGGVAWADWDGDDKEEEPRHDWPRSRGLLVATTLRTPEAVLRELAPLRPAGCVWAGDVKVPPHAGWLARAWW